MNDHLHNLRIRWLKPDSMTCMSILLAATNYILSSAAKQTNKFIDLGRKYKSKPKLNEELVNLRNNVIKLLKQRKFWVPNSEFPSLQIIEDQLCIARSLYNKKIQEVRQSEDSLRDSQLSSFHKNPSTVFKDIKKNKRSSTNPISKLHVGDSTFDCVQDGFHRSLSLLKDPDMSSIELTPSFIETKRDYDHVMKLARAGNRIPAITIAQSVDILYNVRDDVSDLFSITAAHYINAGAPGIRHFHLLMSALIENIDNSKLRELNDIWAMILHKGHGKDKESDRSYRTISTCPLLAKCLDIYIGKLYYPLWRQVQARTQFQGEGSSHELASLLLTEAIQYSVHKTKTPIFVLFLDAKSAFDVVIRQNVIVDAYKAGTRDQGLIYLDNRMKNRRTFPQWETTLLGLIEDKRGLEQGAVNSDRLYKLYNNTQLTEAQDSGLGIMLGDIITASIGQADDCALISDCPVKLQCLLYLTSLHCVRKHVELVLEKTKLLVWSPSSQKSKTNLLKLQCPLTFDSHMIRYVESAEHVGVRRSTTGGNMSNIVERIAAHNRAIGSLLHTGLARHHGANPSASINLERLYGSSVLFSGLASLVLNKKEVSAISKHHRRTICRLQKLPNNTPDCVVYFLGGSLPAAAILDLRMLSIL